MKTHPDPIDFTSHFPWRSCAFTTLTGVDAFVDLDRLQQVSQHHHGRVEWGVLLGRGAGNRYPDLATIKALADVRAGNPDMRLALHLCGTYARQWIDGDVQVCNLANRFDRIQVNIIASDRRVDLKALRQALFDDRHQAVITQHNTANQTLTELLADAPNHALLFDASGGRGVSPGQWPLPIDGKVCGYAGGLSASNVTAALQQISTMANGAFWIDMEASLRTPQDRFSLETCGQVLDAVRAWRRDLDRQVGRFLSVSPSLPSL